MSSIAAWPAACLRPLRLTSIEAMSANVTVADDPAADRARVGFLSYRLDADEIALLHAEVQPAVERRGLGSELVAFALNDARARGLSVLPYCPFVRAYIQSHSQYRALVPEAKRERFGL